MPTANVVLGPAATAYFFTDFLLLPTTNVVLGPAVPAKFAAKSDAVPEAMLIPSVPFPVMLVIVTVREAVPVPETPIVPEAPPVELSETSPFANVTALAPVYVTVYVTGPVFVVDTDGAPMERAGGSRTWSNTSSVGDGRRQAYQCD